MRPFSRDLRESGQHGRRSDADQRLFNDLHGRPWNPCDWRGLGAILPNGRTGDGWFEGPRQWLRLVSVRFFGAADWTCEEGLSAASAEMRARRREMCARTDRRAGE
jgi:hypothetical protein